MSPSRACPGQFPIGSNISHVHLYSWRISSSHYDNGILVAPTRNVSSTITIHPLCSSKVHCFQCRPTSRSRWSTFCASAEKLRFVQRGVFHVFIAGNFGINFNSIPIPDHHGPFWRGDCCWKSTYSGFTLINRWCHVYMQYTYETAVPVSWPLSEILDQQKLKMLGVGKLELLQFQILHLFGKSCTDCGLTDQMK